MNNTLAKTCLVILMNLTVIPLALVWTFLCFAFFPLAFFLMKAIHGHTNRFLVRKCIWIYGHGWQWIFSLFVIFTPPEINPDTFKTPGIIVVNHRSYFDTYCMSMLPVFDVCFAVRDWPFKIPFYSIFMKLAGYLNIETFSWEKILRISKDNFAAGSFFLFFPEGHRSRGGRMTPFYSGAFKLAVDNNVPIIPICLTGTQDLLPPDRGFLMPAKIKMEILDPVFPDRFDGDMKHISLKTYVKHLMKNHITQMEATYLKQHETALLQKKQ